MALTSPDREVASLSDFYCHRYQRLFQDHAVPFGRPVHLPGLLPRLESDPALARDFWALTDSVSRSGSLSRERILNLIASAIAGSQTPPLDSVSHRALDELGARLDLRLNPAQLSDRPFLERKRPTPHPASLEPLENSTPNLQPPGHATEPAAAQPPPFGPGPAQTSRPRPLLTPDEARTTLFARPIFGQRRRSLYAFALLLCALTVGAILLQRNAATTRDDRDNIAASWSPHLPVSSQATLPARSFARPAAANTSFAPSPATTEHPALQAYAAPQTINARSLNHPSLPASTSTSTSQDFAPAAPAVLHQAVRQAASYTPTGPHSTQYLRRNERITVSSGVMASNLIHSQPPRYPRLASLTHAQGSVVIEAVISRYGTVDHVDVIKGNLLLRKSAADAVRHWRYRPYLLNGTPVEVATIITVDYRPKR